MGNQERAIQAERQIDIELLPEAFAVCRLAAEATVPAWAWGGSFTSVAGTPHELSIICPDAGVPSDVQASRGWRALKLRGPFPLTMVGVLLSVARPLAEREISIMAVGTYETDYVLVQGSDLDRAREALADAGHRIVQPVE